ncbi:hypothetical protein ASPCAL14715 [Aspergillus calidoustus]|uniref:Glucose-methanol-choline oxidoreductase N-terminal domain-containing protein n=1 Tax=Aspergillus calidoustus TaxID=454130 RepID=A0A0U5GL93_ASPCI|nr:hypothetical protein ASPCAL14715 [Aspergillus calidoustus]
MFSAALLCCAERSQCKATTTLRKSNTRARYASLAGGNNSWPITSLLIPGLNNRTAGIAAARLLGGGSAINGMAFDQGSPGDYDIWGELIGDNSWSWAGHRPYFKKSGTFMPPTLEQQIECGITFDVDVHGTSGSVQSSYLPFISTTGKVFIAALRQLRIPIQLMTRQMQ